MGRGNIRYDVLYRATQSITIHSVLAEESVMMYYNTNIPFETLILLEILKWGWCDGYLSLNQESYMNDISFVSDEKLMSALVIQITSLDKLMNQYKVCNKPINRQLIYTYQYMLGGGGGWNRGTWISDI